jgi:hypothetical protein
MLVCGDTNKEDKDSTLVIMDIAGLKKKLIELNIPAGDYSLDGALLPMRTILKFADSKWWTFEFDERGRIYEENEFDSLNDACEDMLKRLIYLVEWRKKYGLK